jgi:hypothetical protein
MKSPVTKFDEALLVDARRFLDAIEARPDTRIALEAYGFDQKALDRGRFVVGETARAFEWERAGKAWNYISPTPERREKEALYWYKDARRRYRQACFRAAGAALRSGRGLGALASAAGHAMSAFSPSAAAEQRREFKREIDLARGERPNDAPLPKDTVLVELSGWYDHWSLAARQAFRDKPEVLPSLGLTPGRAPRRLRNKNDRFGRSSAMRRADSDPTDGEPST